MEYFIFALWHWSNIYNQDTSCRHLSKIFIIDFWKVGYLNFKFMKETPNEISKMPLYTTSDQSWKKKKKIHYIKVSLDHFQYVIPC